MKRGLKFWFETTAIGAKIVPLVLAVISWLVIIYGIEAKYIERINDLPIQNRQAVYLCVNNSMLLIFCITLFNVFGESIRSNTQMMYWLVLSKQEYFTYIFMKKIHWYYFFVCLMTLLSGELCGNKVILFLLLTVLYIGIVWFICVEQYAAMYRGSRKTHGQRKAQKFCGERNLFQNHATLELICLSWKYRYASMERGLCKIIVAGIGIFLLSRNMSAKGNFIAYFILFFILTLVDDNYWKKEIRTANLLRTMGISFGKYFFIHTTSGTIFYSFVLSLLCGLASKSVLGGMIFLLVTICFLCYWNSVYLYIYLLIGSQNEWLKQILLIVTLIVQLIPVVHLIAGIFFCRKACMMWRKTRC